METIEERAKKIDARIKGYENLAMKADSSYEFGYMVGATEQKKIDIEKACGIVKELSVLRDGYSDDEEMVNDFRRMMGE